MRLCGNRGSVESGFENMGKDFWGEAFGNAPFGNGVADFGTRNRTDVVGGLDVGEHVVGGNGKVDVVAMADEKDFGQAQEHFERRVPNGHVGDGVRPERLVRTYAEFGTVVFVHAEGSGFSKFPGKEIGTMTTRSAILERVRTAASWARVGGSKAPP